MILFGNESQIEVRFPDSTYSMPLELEIAIRSWNYYIQCNKNKTAL